MYTRVIDDQSSGQNPVRAAITVFNYFSTSPEFLLNHEICDYQLNHGISSLNTLPDTQNFSDLPHTGRPGRPRDAILCFRALTPFVLLEAVCFPWLTIWHYVNRLTRFRPFSYRRTPVSEICRTVPSHSSHVATSIPQPQHLASSPIFIFCMSYPLLTVRYVVVHRHFPITGPAVDWRAANSLGPQSSLENPANYVWLCLLARLADRGWRLHSDKNLADAGVLERDRTIAFVSAAAAAAARRWKGKNQLLDRNLAGGMGV